MPRNTLGHRLLAQKTCWADRLTAVGPTPKSLDCRNLQTVPLLSVEPTAQKCFGILLLNFQGSVFQYGGLPFETSFIS